MTDKKYYKIKKSTLQDILVSASLLGGLTALAFGGAEIDKRHGGIKYTESGSVLPVTIYDSNKDGNPDFTTVGMVTLPMGSVIYYNRDPTQEEINYFNSHYKRRQK